VLVNVDADDNIEGGIGRRNRIGPTRQDRFSEEGLDLRDLVGFVLDPGPMATMSPELKIENTVVVSVGDQQALFAGSVTDLLQQ
jgi:hypothetical protein